MTGREPKLPEKSAIFDLLPLPGPMMPMPPEWIIDWPYIARLKDDDVIKAVTKIKMDYIAKRAELENQIKVLDANMRKELTKTVRL